MTRSQLCEAMVVGFAYCGDDVLLISKMRPDWQRGKLNGVGGHIDSYESSAEAMCREFQEETSVQTPVKLWNARVRLTGQGWRVEFFGIWLDKHQRGEIRQTTDENPIWIPMNRLWGEPVIPNLRWLVPLCRDMSVSAETRGPFLYPAEVIALQDMS